MKRSLLTTLGLLLFLAVPQMFADVASQLILASGSLTCTIDVSDTNVITSSADCAGLTITSTGAHGTLEVSGTFNGLSITDTAKGYNATVYPQVQGLNDVDVKTTTGGVSITSTFTDTAADEAGDPCLQGTASCLLVSPDTFTITDTLNSVLAAGSATYSALNAPDTGVDNDVIPATNLINPAPPTLTGTVDIFQGTFANPAPGAPYSLTSKITISFTKAGQIDANQQISITTPVPEPAGILFMGTMLLFTSVGLRRWKFAR